MFSKEEVKAFIIRLGEKWFFPDFTNKLTWYVVTLGAGFILIPQPIKLFVINWAIEIFNVNSGLKLTLPEMEASNDYATGISIIFMALTHNIGYKYFGLKQKIFEHKVRQEQRISDTNLLERFMNEFSSNCPSAVLLKEHDFGNSFDRDRLKQLEEFHYKWNGAEYHFIDSEIDSKRNLLHEKSTQFLIKVAEYTTPVGASSFRSVVPDHLRADDWNLPDGVTNEIEELNGLATALFEQHQQFIAYARTKIQS
ncbi:hypothetical protein AO724_10055 [Aeromonas allosaccharophila]|uniref:hypothetical protein n=1 Tax=Aeromonas allosaccharophila TaxID=656 RepID=UPI000717F7EB|nr:hypothetical protein [Aeromonas allosaccharophila]KRW50581.1 hypothetical protein AO724_10055 [Aeromonas allosaccharophila]